MSSKQSRAKARGMSYQRKLADLIRHRFNLSKDDCKSTPAGVNGPDLTLSTEAQKRFPYSLEAKYCRTISVPSWLRQSTEGAYEGTTPIVVFHEFTTKEDYVLVPLSRFLELAAPDVLRLCGQPDTKDGTSCTPVEKAGYSGRVCSQTFASQKCVGGT